MVYRKRSTILKRPLADCFKFRNKIGMDIVLESLKFYRQRKQMIAMLPAYHPLTFPAMVDGKNILVIWVPGGETRPYKVKVSLSAKSTDWA